MEPSTSSRAVSVSIMMGVLALLAVVIPFSSVKKTKQPRATPLILRTDAEIALLKGDRNGNQTEDWKDIILETMSTSTKEQAERAPTDALTLERLRDPNNLTSSFSKNIYTASAFIAKNPTIGEEEQANLISGLIEKESSKIKPKIYTLDDIPLSRGDITTEKKKYGNSMALLLKKADSYDLTSDDLAQLAKYNETKDVADLAFFSTKRDNVQKVLEDLLSITVPPSAAIFHVNLINAVSLFVLSLDAFASTKEDPIKSLAFLNSYEETTKDLFIKIAAVQDYFTLEKVPFTGSEPGYVFINKK